MVLPPSIRNAVCVSTWNRYHRCVYVWQLITVVVVFTTRDTLPPGCKVGCSIASKCNLGAYLPQDIYIGYKPPYCTYYYSILHIYTFYRNGGNLDSWRFESLVVKLHNNCYFSLQLICTVLPPILPLPQHACPSHISLNQHTHTGPALC